MTKHRSREQRIDEILAAAAEEIDENGYPRLTMDAIAARTTLSKASIYRFFSNKRDIALALFKDIFEQEMAFEIDDVLSWNLPLTETLFRVLVERHSRDYEARRNRVWLQLIPETLQDEEFATTKRNNTERGKAVYAELIRAIVERDGLRVRSAFEERVGAALGIGAGLMEGLAIEGRSETDLPIQHTYLKRFIEIMVNQMLEDPHDG